MAESPFQGHESCVKETVALVRYNEAAFKRSYSLTQDEEHYHPVQYPEFLLWVEIHELSRLEVVGGGAIQVGSQVTQIPSQEFTGWDNWLVDQRGTVVALGEFQLLDLLLSYEYHGIEEFVTVFFATP